MAPRRAHNDTAARFRRVGCLCSLATCFMSCVVCCREAQCGVCFMQTRMSLEAMILDG